VQARYGAWFCGHGIMLIELRRDRGLMFLNDRELVPVDNVPEWALAQFRGTKLIEVL